MTMETLLKVVLREKTRLAGERSSTLHTVTPDTSFAEAVCRMSEANIGCLLVIDDGCLIGIVTERDVLHRIAQHGAGLEALSVQDVMKTDFHSAPPDLTVETALAQCTDLRIRHLPVVEQGRLLGILSMGDLVYYVVKDKERKLTDVTEYVFGRQIRL
jgi:CBS domain-containing protein